VQVFIHEGARKRGNSDDQIRTVWESDADNWCWLDSRDVPRQLRIGYDATGLDYEVIALIFDDERALIIHFMRARPVSYEEIEKSRRQ